MTQKKPWTMQAKAGVGEIFLYDEIGGGFFSEGITAKTFSADLKAMGAISTLNIFINSPGGSVFEGVAIYNILDRHRAHKVVSIDGLAASIASVIAMAGDERSIAANALIMIHDPWSMAVGSAEDMRRTADTLDKIRTTLVDTYVRQTTTGEDQISTMMTAETWLNADEALEMGFVDTIGAEIEVSAKFDLSKFKHPPPHLAKDPSRTGGVRGGQNLADTLNDRIAELVTDDRSESDIIADMAEEAGIDTGTVTQILRAEINCPPVDRLEGFARALDVSAASLTSAAERDGCNYETEENAARKRRKNPCQAAPSDAAPTVHRLLAGARDSLRKRGITAREGSRHGPR